MLQVPAHGSGCLQLPCRSRGLYKAFAIKFVADLVGPQLASITLRHSMWLPYLISGMCLLLSFPVLIFLPETMQMGTQPSAPSSSGSLRDILRNVGLRPYRRLFTDWRIILSMAIVFLSQFRYLTESVLIPYTSVRFGWSIAEVGKLIIPGLIYAH
jgi:hypothetical protein